MTEQSLLQSILIEFGSMPGLRIWRHNVGAARSKSGALVRFGIKGQPDIMGIIAPTGRFVCIECKSRLGKLTEEQVRWQEMARSLGALCIVARTTADVRRALQSAMSLPSSGTTGTTSP